jgi:inosine-uridine nucleoside N-ribohydrolase
MDKEEHMRRIILDTDPGIDDALALMLALASPEVRIEAVTTVSGNVHVDFTTRNALALLELLGRGDIPVARGSAWPLLRKPVDAAFVHGDNGLGQVELPEPHIKTVGKHAIDVIIETILSAPGEISLVAIGPLTNIALAARREPAIIQQVREVVIMGGALLVPGNGTPTAEFNIFADPHAAHIVLHAGWPVRLVALDVTMQTPLQREQVATLVRSGSPVMRVIKQMLDFYFDVFAPAYGVTAFHMHDPLSLAAAFRPELLNWKPVYVDVELQSSLTMGETVAFFGRPHIPPPNVLAAVGVDTEQFIQLFMQRIEEHFG